MADKSGNFRLRVPPALHAHLADLAEERKVSLNTLCAMLLTAGSGYELGARTMLGSSGGELKRRGAARRKASTGATPVASRRSKSGRTHPRGLKASPGPRPEA